MELANTFGSLVMRPRKTCATIFNLYFLQALNQLFEKIMALDIEERHLLRLGHGEEALETEKDFSRFVQAGCTE